MIIQSILYYKKIIKPVLVVLGGIGMGIFTPILGDEWGRGNLFSYHVAYAASPQVIIHEVAWMGTSTSANAEWIELFNKGSESVNMKDWILTAQDGSPSIILSGTIAPGGYYILERTSDDTLPGIPANQIYTGSLSNIGEDLLLKDSSGTLVDRIDQANGWLGGDNTTKQTLQLITTTWKTGDPTPGAANTFSDPTPMREDSETPPKNDENSPNDDVSLGGTPTKIPPPKTISPRNIQPDPFFRSKVFIPEMVTLGNPLTAKVLVTQGKLTDLVTGKFEWSMGDGRGYTFLQNTPLVHFYDYPGDYVVTLLYYANAFKEEPDALYSQRVHVGTSQLLLKKHHDALDTLEIVNQSEGKLDISGWNLFNGTHYVLFPRYTYIEKGTSLRVSLRHLGLSKGTSLILRNTTFQEIVTLVTP